MLGHASRANAVTAFETLAPKSQKFWPVIGYMGLASAVLILAFYTGVAGWVFAYFFKSISGSIHSTDPASTKAAFSAMVPNPLQALFWQWLVLAGAGAIIMLGVSKGIEAAAKKTHASFIFAFSITMRTQPYPTGRNGRRKILVCT